MSFKSYEKNIQSQFGEDGVIEEIFNRIGTSNKICIEFGAWDGIHLSNSWALWKNKEWKALLIEGDKNKFVELKNNTKECANVIPYLAFVAVDGENSLESIVKKNQLPLEPDMLSIDIDGDDYYIFESLTELKPRLILIEYNPTIPPAFDLKQAKGEYFGASALSLLRLAHRKGYKLAHLTDTNLFFVHENSFSKLNIKEPALEDIFVNTHLVHVVSSYDGKSFLLGKPPYSIYNLIKSDVKFPVLISSDVPMEKVIINKV